MANFDAFFDVIEHSKTRIKRTNVRKKIQNHHIQRHNRFVVLLWAVVIGENVVILQAKKIKLRKEE